jgi:hypothetical protein
MQAIRAVVSQIAEKFQPEKIILWILSSAHPGSWKSVSPWEISSCLKSRPRVRYSMSDIVSEWVEKAVGFTDPQPI